MFMKGRDTLADLRSAVFYFENIAEHNDNDDRQAVLKDTVTQLQRIIDTIEEEIKSMRNTPSF